jgi:hypothetical protein
MDELRLSEIKQQLHWMNGQTAAAGHDFQTGVEAAVELLQEVRRLQDKVRRLE